MPTRPRRCRNNPIIGRLGAYATQIKAGLTPFAAENDIKILRRVEGKEYVRPFRYADVRKGRKLEQNILLRSGDTVVVP